MKFILHKYQVLAHYALQQIIIMAAGIQSGKTSMGSYWSGLKATNGSRSANHIIVAPTYKILQQASLPKFLGTWSKFGKYNKVDSTFKWSHGPTTYIRSMTDPNSCEGITDVESIWADECGLLSRFAWENIMGRAAFKQAQIIGTTTPYALNWLYQLWIDWNKGKRDDVSFITFKSTDNPNFPQAEYDRQKGILDITRFNMKYNGVFGQMEGLVYPNVNRCQSFIMPIGTQYYAGVDWGYTNPFALVIRAITPDGLHYRISEYYRTQMTLEEMIEICKVRQQMFNIEIFVCDPAEPKSIESFNRAGLTSIPGDNSIRTGIDCHLRLIKEKRFFIFEDLNPEGLDEYSTYHYPEDKEVKIDDDAKEQLPVKQNDHGMDADRLVTMFLEYNKSLKKSSPFVPNENKEIPREPYKKIDYLKNRNRGGFVRHD